ncbi:MAG: Bor family protein [Gemmatimonadota bacterium]|nr:MAG: Bor family protein [Gemmatimonadota bacterium]
MHRHSACRALASLALIALLPVMAACFHSIVDTGLTPGAVGYHGKWETAWLVGLIPAEVDAEAVCEGPWARVETQQSFLNGLVSILTIGIYSPHEVEVVCAAPAAGGDSDGG